MKTNYLLTFVIGLFGLLLTTPSLAFVGDSSITKTTTIKKTRKEKRAFRKQLWQEIKAYKKSRRNQKTPPRGIEGLFWILIRIILISIALCALLGLSLLIIGLVAPFSSWMVWVGSILLLSAVTTLRLLFLI